MEMAGLKYPQSSTNVFDWYIDENGEVNRSATNLNAIRDDMQDHQINSINKVLYNELILIMQKLL